ncbi:hypothetical protein HHI36_004255 [Cryptolaemus montrouzieri]|uniref:Uncharacterized protein n=1 Tax=Cryptolaemus montrouzieri TaxID=559131 RepID=A0ABD2NQN2_9CUCU
MRRESMDEIMKEKWRKEWKREEDRKWGGALFDHCWNEWIVREHGTLSYWMTKVLTATVVSTAISGESAREAKGNVGHVEAKLKRRMVVDELLKIILDNEESWKETSEMVEKIIRRKLEFEGAKEDKRPIISLKSSLTGGQFFIEMGEIWN